MEKPLVSVIMPVYNGEKYIGKAIESVLAQNVPIELLVIDDCSTDKTELTVMKYMDSGNIRYLQIQGRDGRDERHRDPVFSDGQRPEKGGDLRSADGVCGGAVGKGQAGSTGKDDGAYRM